MTTAVAIDPREAWKRAAAERAVELAAARLGISLTALEDHPILDVTIDGADEVDPVSLALIKGGGGGVHAETIGLVLAAGAHVAVVGSGLFNTESSVTNNLAQLTRAIERAKGERK